MTMNAWLLFLLFTFLRKTFLCLSDAFISHCFPLQVAYDKSGIYAEESILCLLLGLFSLNDYLSGIWSQPSVHPVSESICAMSVTNGRRTDKHKTNHVSCRWNQRALFHL